MKDIHFDQWRIDNIVQWPAKYKLMLMIMLTLFSMILGYVFFVSSHWDHYKNLQSQTYRLKADLEVKYKNVAQLPDYRIQIRAIKKQAEDVFKSLVSEHEMPGLLDDLSKIAISTGLSFELLTPLAEVQHDVYIESPIQLSVLATYQQLTAFIHRIVQMPRMIIVDRFLVYVDQKQKTKDQLHIDMILKIYRYRYS